VSLLGTANAAIWRTQEHKGQYSLPYWKHKLNQQAMKLPTAVFLPILAVATNRSSWRGKEIRFLTNWTDLKTSCGKSGTYYLSGASFDIGDYDSEIGIFGNDPHVIFGNGAVLDAAGKGRFFTVSGALTLHEMTLKRGRADGGWNPPAFSGGGGAVNNEGTLNIHGVTFVNNSAYPVGGAIVNYGTVVVNNAMFVSNQAQGGGAIASRGAGGVNICEFRTVG
jgi:hypothetical protein